MFDLQLLVLACFTTSILCEIGEMKFTKWPEFYTAPIGDRVTFECTVKVPGQRLWWRWRPLEPEDAPWEDLPGPIELETFTTTRYTVEVKDEKQAGYYQCVVYYGAVTLASVPGRLTIAKIDLSANSAEKRVLRAPVGNTIALHCREPLSDPPAALNWWKDEKGKRRVINTPHGVLVLPNVTREDSGTYVCTATNALSGQVVDLPEKTYLQVKDEYRSEARFLETDDFVGIVDAEGVLTMPVRPETALRLSCGIVGQPQPRVTWSRNNGPIPGRASVDGGQLTINKFTQEDEGIYTCSGGGVSRSWSVPVYSIATRDPGTPVGGEGEMSRGEVSRGEVSRGEGTTARVECAPPTGYPRPRAAWTINAQPVGKDTSITTTASELFIENLQKRHAGIVQCFACNSIGCAYDAVLLSVVPVQISSDNSDYSMENGKPVNDASSSPKRHNKKNSRKHKGSPAVLVPPSKPTVTRMSDTSVMVSWHNANHGLPIRFFKVQYREDKPGNNSNKGNSNWQTANDDIPPHIHSYEVHQLVPDKYYRFRIAAVYSNQDNKLGRISGKFYLQRGGFKAPKAPVLTKATPVSPYSIQLNWTWSGSSSSVVGCEGFYVYYRGVSSAGQYEKVTAGPLARHLALTHLHPDTWYEVKVQSYTAQAPSEFSSILTARTLRLQNATVSSTTLAPSVEEPAESRYSVLLCATGAGMAALLVVAVTGLMLCRRCAPQQKEKVSVPEAGNGNGYIPAKVPISITANPMHAESGENGGVEMSFLHNNNTGTEDGTLPLNNQNHTRKNGLPSRQYV